MWQSLNVLGYCVLFVATFAVFTGKKINVSHLILFAIAAISVCAAYIQPKVVNAKWVSMDGGASDLKPINNTVSLPETKPLMLTVPGLE